MRRRAGTCPQAGGKSWIYVYGAGGIYWRTIQHLRALMKDIPVGECQAMLKLMRYEPRYVASSSTTGTPSTSAPIPPPTSRRGWPRSDSSSPERLKYGVSYDTSHRRFSTTSAIEQEMMGEGDLRYLLTRSTDAPRAGTRSSTKVSTDPRIAGRQHRRDRTGVLRVPPGRRGIALDARRRERAPSARPASTPLRVGDFDLAAFHASLERIAQLARELHQP